MKAHAEKQETDKASGGSKRNYVYILRCADGTLYTGWTTDLEARMETHNSGTGAKYTRGRGPVQLIYSECFETKREALRREAAIKKMKRDRKLKLVGLGREIPTNE